MTSPAIRTGSTGPDQLFLGRVKENRRVKTGIPQLDEMLRGGFLAGDAVLLAGSAGTGKTTLALQYLVNGITQFGERGIYVSFEQLPTQIYRDGESFGWDLRKMEDENKLRMICTSPTVLQATGGEENILRESIKEIQPQRIVIDSLSHLTLYSDEKDMRKELYRLIMLLKSRGLSSILTWEAGQMEGQPMHISDVGSSFLVDCILMLKHVEIESSMRKALMVLKMRGSDHDKHLREYEITSQGFKIESVFADYEGLTSGVPRKVASEKFMEMFRKASDRRS